MKTYTGLVSSEIFVGCSRGVIDPPVGPIACRVVTVLMRTELSPGVLAAGQALIFACINDEDIAYLYERGVAVSGMPEGLGPYGELPYQTTVESLIEALPCTAVAFTI